MDRWNRVGYGEGLVRSAAPSAPTGRGGSRVAAATAGEVARAAAAALAEAALELLSPTRCCGCERPGPLVCGRCLGELSLIDPRRACLRCGAPFGDIACTECAGAGLGEDAGAAGGDGGRAPAADAVSRCLAMAAYEGPLPRIIRAYKDAGELRLAPLLAEMLLDCALHAQIAAPDRYGGLLDGADALCFVPATASAFRRRGFDHMEAVARPLGELAGIPVADVLLKHGSGDQRAHGRSGRRAAARGMYEAVSGLGGMRVVLVDDVVTTGATISAAAAALREAGAARVDALALARVWGR